MASPDSISNNSLRGERHMEIDRAAPQRLRRKKYMFPQLGFWSLLSAHW